MEYLIVPMILIGGLWAIASVANNWEAITNGEPLGAIKEKKLCHLHSWKKATFLNFKDFDTYKQDPTKFEHLKTDYCEDCGFVPQYDKMVIPKFLEELKEHDKQVAAREQREKDIAELKAEFLKTFLEEYRAKKGAVLADGDEKAITLGYEAYDTFLCYLPKLVQARELARILRKL